MNYADFVCRWNILLKHTAEVLLLVFTVIGFAMPGSSAQVLTFGLLTLDTTGLYRAVWEDPNCPVAKAEVTYSFYITVLPKGTVIPLAGPLGLALLALACAAGGARKLRRAQRE